MELWPTVFTRLNLDLLFFLSGLVFLLPLNRRPRFPLRAALSLGAVALFSLLLSALHLGLATSPSGAIVTDVVRMAILFAAVVGQGRLCTHCNLSGCVYCAVWAMVTAQLAHELWLSAGSFLGNGVPPWWQMDVWFLIWYLALGFTVARWMPERGAYHIGPRQLSLAVLITLFSGSLYTLLFYFAAADAGAFSPARVVITLVQVYGATVLYLQSVLFQKSAMRQELMTLNLLWQQNKAQYSLAKENIDLINRKCHDLKHQMRLLDTLACSEERRQYVSELENSIQIYDSMVKTGNEALDTILTEKNLYCEANHILINCVADGSRLGFINPVDLYAMFGNALSNAIESVQVIQDPGKRVIDVLVYVKQRFLSITISNPLTGELRFEDGLPVTTKEKNGYHGFGLKSIRHTAEKYGGFVTVEVKEGCFSLRILFPLAS